MGAEWEAACRGNEPKSYDRTKFRENRCDRKAAYWSQVVTHIAIPEGRWEWKKPVPGVPLSVLAKLLEWGCSTEGSWYNDEAELLEVGVCPSGTRASVAVPSGGAGPFFQSHYTIEKLKKQEGE